MAKFMVKDELACEPVAQQHLLLERICGFLEREFHV